MTNNKIISHTPYFLANQSRTYSALLHMINNADNDQNTSIPQAFKKYLNKIIDPYTHLNNLKFIKDINDVDLAIRPFTLTKENKKLITNAVYALIPDLKNQ